MLALIGIYGLLILLVLELLWVFGALLRMAGDVIRLVHAEVNLISASTPLLMTAIAIAAASLIEFKAGLALPPRAYAATLAIAAVELAATRISAAVPSAWVERGQARAWILGWGLASSIAVASSALGGSLGHPSKVITVIVFGSLVYPFVFGVIYPAVHGAPGTEPPAHSNLIVIEHGWRNETPSPQRDKARTTRSQIWRAFYRWLESVRLDRASPTPRHDRRREFHRRTPRTAGRRELHDLRHPTAI
jgi:hypothetical protein